MDKSAQRRSNPAPEKTASLRILGLNTDEQQPQLDQQVHPAEVPSSSSPLVKQQLARPRVSEAVLSCWFFEIISWGIGAMCITVIITILVMMDQAKRPGLQFAPTTIAILSKIATIFLFIPIAEAVGQLKWKWFQGGKARDLADFEIFDKASRGPLGSFRLLFITKGRGLAAFGALLTILTFAIDIFFQQAIQKVVRVVEDPIGVCSLPVVVRYEPKFDTILRDNQSQPDVDWDLKTVTEQFLFGNGTSEILFGNGSVPDIPVLCNRNNCTWEPYDTLGVCSKCEDVSNSFRFACVSPQSARPSNVTQLGMGDSLWPNATKCGHFLAVPGQSLLMAGYRIDNDLGKPEEGLLMRAVPLSGSAKQLLLGGNSRKPEIIDAPIAEFVVSSSQDGTAESIYRNDTPIANQCSLYWCVKRLSSSFDSGYYSERVLETYTNESFKKPGASHNDSAANDTMLRNTEDILISGGTLDKNNYGLTRAAHNNVASMFNTFLPSFTMAKSRSSEYWMTFETHSAANKTHLPLANPWLRPHTVPEHVSRLATAMSNSLRRSTEPESFQDGKAVEEVEYMTVQLGWTAFPLAILLSSLWFLVTTIRLSAKEQETGIWKTSLMPMLIYGLPKDVQTKVTNNGRTWADAVETDAGRTKVKLIPGKGWAITHHDEVPAEAVARKDGSPVCSEGAV